MPEMNGYEMMRNIPLAAIPTLPHPCPHGKGHEGRPLEALRPARPTTSQNRRQHRAAAVAASRLAVSAKEKLPHTHENRRVLSSRPAEESRRPRSRCRARSIARSCARPSPTRPCSVRHDFAALVLDIKMPGISGIEPATLIKQRKRSEGVDHPVPTRTP